MVYNVQLFFGSQIDQVLQNTNKSDVAKKEKRKTKPTYTSLVFELKMQQFKINLHLLGVGRDSLSKIENLANLITPRKVILFETNPKLSFQSFAATIR